MLRRRAGEVLGILLVFVSSTAARGQSDVSVEHQSLDDAWWTGPLLAATAATLPEGHYLAESYLSEAVLDGDYTASGKLHRTPREDSFGSLSYLLYGLTDRVMIGLIPRFGFHNVTQGRSDGIGVGDLTIQAQYLLTRFVEGGSLPTLSLAVGETLPTGYYDRLNSPKAGFGLGVYTTTLSAYSQYCLWMPNGRIVRTRLDVSYAFSNDANVQEVSVYGTTAGFRGRAKPGDSITVDSGWEYNVTQHWVFALDVFYGHGNGALVSGSYPAGGISISDFRLHSGASQSFEAAPAAEYNWNSHTGLIVGVLRTLAGRNSSVITMPVWQSIWSSNPLDALSGSTVLPPSSNTPRKRRSGSTALATHLTILARLRIPTRFVFEHVLPGDSVLF